MKPSKGKHAPNPGGGSGGCTAPCGGVRPLEVAPRGPLFSPVRCASSAVPPQSRGPLFTSPGRLRTTSCRAWRRCSGSQMLQGFLFLRRPRMGGGLCSLPQVATGNDYGMGTAPVPGAPSKPQGFSLQNGQPPPMRTDHAARPTTGWTRRPCQAPPASLRAFLFRMVSHRP